jgi:hypothetical protein
MSRFEKISSINQSQMGIRKQKKLNWPQKKKSPKIGLRKDLNEMVIPKHSSELTLPNCEDQLYFS